MADDALTTEAAASVLRGEFSGSSKSILQTCVIDEDGDATTIKRVDDRVVCSVTHPSGREEHIGTVTRIVFYTDTLVLHAFLEQQPGADAAAEESEERDTAEGGEQAAVTPPTPSSPADGKQHGWKMPFRKGQTAAQHISTLKNLFRVCGHGEGAVSLHVGRENPPLSNAPLDKLCAEYSALLGSSVLSGGAREQRCEEYRLETQARFAQCEKDMIEVHQVHHHILDEVLPELSETAQQLQVMYTHIDALETYMDEFLSLLTQLEEATVTHQAQSLSLVSAAKRLFSFKKRPGTTDGATDILTIGGLPPPEFEQRFRASLRNFKQVEHKDDLPDLKP
eukprot:Rhum_TRINITY_DN1574_c0_g1::Rhum_TRINITY_DN1574_c0_g1_i1::g.4485::m.4485